MSHTLIAAFDNLSEARAAKSALLAQSVVESNINISSSSDDSVAIGGNTPAAGATHFQDDTFADKVSHFFGTLFGSDEDDHSNKNVTAYSDAYRNGATVLTVTVINDDEVDRAQQILESNGAVDIDERGSTWGAQGATHVGGTHIGVGETASGHTAASLDGRAAIPVIQEDLQVGKREVNTGRVRVVSRINERPVEETISLREEHAEIERRPVDRPATVQDLDAFESGTVEITETAERAIVQKTARVVEEVVVGRQTSEHNETVRDTVRNTEVDVQRDDASNDGAPKH